MIRFKNTPLRFNKLSTAITCHWTVMSLPVFQESQGSYDRKAWDLLHDEVSGSNTLIPIGVLYSLLSFEAQNIFFACFMFFPVFPERFGPEMSNLQKMPFQNMLQIQCKKCKWEVQIHSKHQISQKCKWDMKIYRKKKQKQFTFNIPASTKQFHINGPYISIYMFHFMFSTYFPYLQFSRVSWLSSALLWLHSGGVTFFIPSGHGHLTPRWWQRREDGRRFSTSCGDQLLSWEIRGFLAVCYGKYPLIYDLPIKQKWSSIAMWT